MCVDARDSLQLIRPRVLNPEEALALVPSIHLLMDWPLLADVTWNSHCGAISHHNLLPKMEVAHIDASGSNEEHDKTVAKKPAEQFGWKEDV